MPEPRLPRSRYQILGLLGSGGMASVWRVLDVRLGVERAVKVLPPGVLREAQLSASIAHPNVVTVHDVLDVPEGTAVVMELAQGSLADHVAAHGPLPPADAARIMAEVCDALAAAHASGVVHRDVKPQNLLVFAGSRVKLADFGIAGLLDADAPVESTRGLFGSVPFMAPEHRRGRAEAASDVYGAAVTLAWLLTGELSGDLYVDAVIDALRARLATAGALVDLLARAGAHAPAERPSAADLRDGLRAFAGDAPLRLAPSPRTAPSAVRTALRRVAPAGASRRLAYVGGAALAGAVFAVPLGVRVGRGPGDSLAVARLRAYEALPVCADTPTRMELQVYPRWETDPPGGREASAGRMVDVDGDGKRDLLFGHAIDADFRVFWGTGAAFATPGQQIQGARTTKAFRDVVDAADVDGDGVKDLLGASPEDMSFVVVPGLGRRGFGEPVRVETGGGPLALRAADWDGDGRADLVFSISVYGEGPVMWRRSLGGGAFDAERQLSATSDAFDVLTDADGKARALVVLEDGHLKRYPVRADARRAADPDLDVRVPVDRAVSVRAVSRTDHVYIWNPWVGGTSVRVSLTDGSACTYDLGSPIFDVGYFDDDDLLDATGTITCSYCTSSYQLLLGTR